MKKATANRGGERTMPPTMRVAGAFGKEGKDRKRPVRAGAARKLPNVGRRRRAS